VTGVQTCALPICLTCKFLPLSKCSLRVICKVHFNVAFSLYLFLLLLWITKSLITNVFLLLFSLKMVECFLRPIESANHEFRIGWIFLNTLYVYYRPVSLQNQKQRVLTVLR